LERLCIFIAFFSSVVDRHRFEAIPDPDQDPTFLFDVDPDPDPDPDPTLSFTHIGKSETFLS
jgi:hypothetical protein